MVAEVIDLVQYAGNFWPRVAIGDPDACWPWQGAVYTQTGYGVFHPAHDFQTTAHAFAHDLTYGVPPAEWHRDHTCHNDTACLGGRSCVHRLCCNPSHLEAVPSDENRARSHRANEKKIHCPRGHAYTPDNVRLQFKVSTVSRKCKRCEREFGWNPRRAELQRQRRAARKAA